MPINTVHVQSTDSNSENVEKESKRNSEEKREENLKNGHKGAKPQNDHDRNDVAPPAMSMKKIRNDKDKLKTKKDAEENPNITDDVDEEGVKEKERSSKSKCLHVTLFLFLFANDLADFVSDWLFFTDVVITEKGLVYGAVEPEVKWTLLLFSIIGTITFAIECYNLYYEFVKNDPWLDSDILQAVVIWIEDIPQVAISLHLALCREEPVSIFQLTKAGVIIVGVFIRIIVACVKYCNRAAIKSHHHVKWKVVIMLGIILEASCAIAIFFFTQTERTLDGNVSFRVPTTVLEETYNDKRYFSNVSVFVHHSLYFDSGALDQDKTDSEVNWMRLVSLQRLRKGDKGEAWFRIDYELVATTFKMAIWEKHGHGSSWSITECYTADQSTAKITEEVNTTCIAPGYFSNKQIVFIKFWYKEPGQFFKKQVFGDIHVNMRLLENGKCIPLENFTDTIESSIDRNIPLTIHYYRTNDTMLPERIKHLYKDPSGTPRFYRNEGPDLIDIPTVWKTGWRECDSTGSFAPNIDRDLEMDCSLSP